MKKLYTAVGCFEKRRGGIGKHYPVVMIGKKEHILDIHEMMIWVILNWRILGLAQVENFYGKKLSEINVVSEKECIVYIERLLQRGLIVQGNGETDSDAMYDLFSGLHIVPVTGNLYDKVVSFFKLSFFNRVPFRTAARELFRKAAYNADEKKVLNLSKQAFLTTAELMKCVEVGAKDISTDEKANDILYSDDNTTCDNLIFTAKTYRCRIPVMTAVINLYFRKQILFTKVAVL